MTRIDPLPDDPALLKQIIVERDALIQRIKHEAAEQMESLRQRMEAEHKAVVAALFRRYYGPRSGLVQLPDSTS